MNSNELSDYLVWKFGKFRLKGDQMECTSITYFSWSLMKVLSVET